MTTEHQTSGLIGASPKRVEDPPLITGKGCYTDDIQLPGMLYLGSSEALPACENYVSTAPKPNPCRRRTGHPGDDLPRKLISAPSGAAEHGHSPHPVTRPRRGMRRRAGRRRAAKTGAREDAAHAIVANMTPARRSNDEDALKRRALAHQS